MKDITRKKLNYAKRQANNNYKTLRELQSQNGRISNHSFNEHLVEALISQVTILKELGDVMEELLK